ncbi:MAG TPA: hypothetical protein PKE55_14275, partial [Kiritimatiellia bacterium]|nr:hypothetical protein [Kiritimatiellia bacterium]
ITASIMCKKMAEGIDALVLDVKCGSGAFMKTLDDARTLAKSMVDVGNAMGKKVSALITDMNQPLGHTAGNALEVVESIETLQGKGPQDLTDLTVALTVEMVVLSFPDRDPVDIEKQARAALEDGTAFAKFKEMAALQGADTATLDDPSRLAKATLIEPFPAPADGWVSSVSADKVGRACLILGAGRAKTDDVVDFAVGISGLAKIGQIVAKGDPLAVIHANHPEKLAEAKAMLEGFAGISSTAVTPPPLILEHLAAHA